MVQMKLELLTRRLFRKIGCITFGHIYISFKILQDHNRESDFEQFCRNCGRLNINNINGLYSDVGRNLYEKEVLPLREREAFEQVYGRAA